MPEFLIRVTNDESGNIRSLYSPDFGVELLEYSNSTDINNNYRAFIIDIFITHLLDSAKQATPKTLKELKYVPIHHLQRWEFFEIDCQAKQINSGIFYKVLPRMGHITNILVMLSGGVITFMALKIASADNDTKSFSSSNAMSILGTILSSMIYVIMYLYSDATEMLATIGQNIDHSLAKTCRRNYELLPTVKENSGSNQSTYSKKFITLLAAGVLFTNALTNGVTTYQEGILVVDKYLDLYQDLSETERETAKRLLRWIVVNVLVFAGTSTDLAFQGSFATKLVEELCNKFEKHKTSKHQVNELPRNTNNSVFFQYANASSSPPHLAQASDLQSSPLPLLEDRQPRTTPYCSLC